MHGILFNVAEKSYQNRTAGIYRIAHFLRENGADIEVVDWANHWSLQQLKELFQSRYNSDLKFIAFSHMFSIWDDVLEIFCAWVKKNYPHIKIFSGSSSPPYFKSKFIDFYIFGFGEFATLELIKYICGNGARPKFSLQMANGKPLMDANSHYPAYPMKSLMIKYQDRDFLQPEEWLAIEFSRGCKFHCDFCNFPVLGVKGDYTRDAEDFEEHVREVYDRFGIVNYAVADDTFNDRTEKIIKFANVVETLPFQPHFTGFVRADLFHSRPGDIEEMARMNFFGQFYGIESFNRPSAKSVGKGLDTAKIQSTLLNIKQYFAKHKKPYAGTISLIVGLPHETVDTLENTKHWLIQNWQGQAFIAHTMSIPTMSKPIHENYKSYISEDYTKYGYRELSKFEIQNKINEPGTQKSKSDVNKTKVSPEELIWANEHMDIFQAQKITEEFANLKHHYDFRLANFNYAFRTNCKTLQEKLLLQSVDDTRYNESIQPYVNAKLNHNVAISN